MLLGRRWSAFFVSIWRSWDFWRQVGAFCALTLSPGADTILEDGVRFNALRPVCFHGLVFFVLCAGFQFGVCGFLQWCNLGLA